MQITFCTKFRKKSKKVGVDHWYRCRPDTFACLRRQYAPSYISRHHGKSKKWTKTISSSNFAQISKSCVLCACAAVDPTYLRPAAQVCAFQNILHHHAEGKMTKKNLKPQIMHRIRKVASRTHAPQSTPHIDPAAQVCAFQNILRHHAEGKLTKKIFIMKFYVD